MFYLMSFYLLIFNSINWLISIYMIIFKKMICIEWNIFYINSSKIIYMIYLDWMSTMFMSVVSMISSMVIIYSMSYMMSDLYLKRFMLLILIFAISMLFMIISPNLISIMLGWDGLGLSSYCLVAYYPSKKSFNSSMITIMMNRIGDILILLSISILMFMGSWNFINTLKMNFYLIILIMIAATTKSAQIPFSAWLPMAMAAPTPISSLVHSSTLVTAGVFLLIRFSHLYNQKFLYILLIISSLTMIMASSSANFEFDIKKIIALSTLSQLSMMLITLTMNMYKLSFLHLINHAMFKSLLFLCSGIIIHNYFNNQDIRSISFMNLNMPFINTSFNIASFSLCGMPFLTGFYSKDLIIEFLLMNNNNWLIMMIMYIATMMTTSYTFRLIFYINMKKLKINLMHMYNSKNLMNYSIIILLLMSMIYGSMMNWLLFSSTNLIYLNKLMKISMNLLLLITIMSTIIILKVTKIKNYKMMKFFNSMWFLSNMMKKNKLNLMNLNKKLILITENSWNEYYMNKIFNYLMMSLFKLKKIYSLYFIMMIMTLFYLMMMILMI